MMDWQPIETADNKPYQPVDLWVRWPNGNSYRIADAYRSGNGKYWLKDGKYIEGRRFYDDGDQCFDRDDKGPEATVVTHWRPLPEAPPQHRE
jgi:Protein of unknown function (DUF551)